MANKLFNDWESLVNGIRDVVPDILYTDVSDRAKHLLRVHIGRDIYGAYKPKVGGWIERGSDGKWRRATYRRRGQLAFDVFAKLENNSTLVVSSSTTPAPSIRPGYSASSGGNGELLRLIEGDSHGLWHGGFPRPAVRNTQSDFATDPGLRNAIQNSIKRRIG